MDAGYTRRVREFLDLTQEEFAHVLGVTVSTVNRWENGHAAPSKPARRAIVRLERGEPADAR